MHKQDNIVYMITPNGTAGNRHHFSYAATEILDDYIIGGGDDENCIEF